MVSSHNVTATTTITTTTAESFQVNLGHPVPPSVPEQNLSGLVEQDFYEMDVFRAMQPSVSNHWREHRALILTTGLVYLQPHS